VLGYIAVSVRNMPKDEIRKFLVLNALNNVPYPKIRSVRDSKTKQKTLILGDAFGPGYPLY